MLFSSEFKEIQSLKCNAKVNDIKFSPDGTLLACALRDGSIDIFFTKKEDNYKKIGACKVCRFSGSAAEIKMSGTFKRSASH